MRAKYEYDYYIIESGELLTIANDFRKHHISIHDQVVKYLLELGASQYNTAFGLQLYGVVFDKEIPEGFSKPNKHGISKPKKKSKHIEKYYSFKFPGPVEYLSKYIKVPTGMGYKYKNGSGGMALGGFNPIGFYWFAKEGDILLKIPNVKYYVNQLKKEYSDIIFEDNVDKWEMPTNGLRKILIEEWDFMAAKYNEENIKND